MVSLFHANYKRQSDVDACRHLYNITHTHTYTHMECINIGEMNINQETYAS